MARHECPDCGHIHEMKAEERIRRLEAKVRDLEAKQHVCPHPHWYWNYYTPNYNPITVTSGTTGTTWTSESPVVVYSTSNALSGGTT